MLPDTFLTHVSLVLAAYQLGQQRRCPARSSVPKLARRLRHDLAQVGLDRIGYLRWAPRPWRFLKARAAFGLKSMQPTPHGVGALARHPGDFRRVMAIVSQEYHLNTSLEPRRVGSVVHLLQALKLSATQRFQADWRSHRTPRQWELPD
jgi:hypothetical protein